jgi:hypothetical protein
VVSDLPPRVIETIVLLLPGGVATLALFPSDVVSIPGRVALSFGCGFAVVGLVSAGLVTFSALNEASFLATLTLVTIGLLIIAIVRGSPRSTLKALVAEIRAEPVALGIGIALIVAVALVRLPFSPLYSIVADTPMRYWADGLEIATAGQIPDQTLQWGTSYEPATSKMLFNSFTASMSLATGPHALANIAGLTWLGALGLMASMWWAARELGLDLLAPLFPLLAISNQLFLSIEMTYDVNPYRAELFGRMLAFCGFALALRALREGWSWPRYIIIGVLFGLAAATHLVPTALLVGVLFCYGVYRFIRRRLTLAETVRLAGGAVAAVAVLFSLWTLPGGNLAFKGTSGDEAFAGVSGGNDPTLLFVSGRRRPLDAADRRGWYAPPQRLMRKYLSAALGVMPDNPWPLLGGITAAMVALLGFAPERLRPVALAALALTVSTVAATLAADRFYSSFALANFGSRRLFDYAPLMLWLLLLLLAEWLLDGLERLRKHAAPALAIVLSAGLGLVLLPNLATAATPMPWVGRQLDDLNWVRANAPCDARILSNIRTGGTYQVLTGRVGVNEGMGPFFRPEMLDRVNRFLVEMNDFFGEPREGKTFLETYGVDYVVLVRGAGANPNLRTALGFPEQMAKSPFLQLVYMGERANIYQVVGTEPAPDLPEASAHEGYGCGRGSIRV